MIKSSMTRRKFVKAAGVAGGMALLSRVMGNFDAHAANATRVKTDPILKDVCDLHIHADPDSTPRLLSELDLARQAKDAGYKSVMFKSIDFSCHDRAYLVQQIIPNFSCFGSLTLNKVHGDKINVFAVQKAVETTGSLCRCIWMPTTNASYQHRFLKLKDKGIPVLDDFGKVLPEVIRVMEICAEANIIFATGHSSPEESIVMARKAKEVGVKKFVVTHANTNWWKMTHDQIKTIVELGGFLEYSYITNLWGPGTAIPNFARMSDMEFIKFVTVVPERSFITTDLGQVNMPNPLDGMRQCIQAMQHAGISQHLIDILVRKNPARLVGLSV